MPHSDHGNNNGAHHKEFNQASGVEKGNIDGVPVPIELQDKFNRVTKECVEETDLHNKTVEVADEYEKESDFEPNKMSVFYSEAEQQAAHMQKMLEEASDYLEKNNRYDESQPLSEQLSAADYKQMPHDVRVSVETMEKTGENLEEYMDCVGEKGGWIQPVPNSFGPSR